MSHPPASTDKPHHSKKQQTTHTQPNTDKQHHCNKQHTTHTTKGPQPQKGGEYEPPTSIDR